jgi:hypothetical protein
MYWLFAQADAANPEGVFNHLLNVVENIFTNPISVTIVFGIVAVLIGGLLDYRFKLRRIEIDGALKQEMIQRGMSADEIERVLAAKSNPKAKKEST